MIRTLGAGAGVVTQNLGGEDITEQHRAEVAVLEAGGESLHKELALLLLLLLLPLLLLLLLLVLVPLLLILLLWFWWLLVVAVRVAVLTMVRPPQVVPFSNFRPAEFGLEPSSTEAGEDLEVDVDFWVSIMVCQVTPRLLEPEITDSRLCWTPTWMMGGSFSSCDTSSGRLSLWLLGEPRVSSIIGLPPPSKTPLFGSSLIFGVIM